MRLLNTKTHTCTYIQLNLQTHAYTETQSRIHANTRTHNHCNIKQTYMYTAKQAWGKLHCKFMHSNTIIIWI